MNLFTCARCSQLLHFENATCLRCGTRLGFLPDRLRLSPIAPGEDGLLVADLDDKGLWQTCGNAGTVDCNWLVPAGTGRDFCDACALNRTIPDLDVAGNLARWTEIEAAKRRLVYALKRLRLPIARQTDETEDGLAFDFVADTEEEKVLTGHADGLVTVNIAEADSAERERRRVAMDEPYRTLLGHLRHEVGHYYWDVLVREGDKLEATRAMFGDERADYAEALEHHYETGPAPGWEQTHVSDYATAHAWEDFAETWAHYLHMVDTLDTARSFGITVDPAVSTDPANDAQVGRDPYAAEDFDTLVEAWLPLTVALNSLNRSMGQPDLYPFVLPPAVIAKLGFIHALVHGHV
jgi:hypothetical protein